jgi:hypothetical protein
VGTAIAALLVLGLVVLDAALFILFGALRFDVADLLLLHGMLCSMAALSALTLARLTAWLQLIGWTACLGPFGALIGAMLLPWNADTAALAAAAPPDPAPSRLTALHTAITDHRLRILGAHASRPLLDIVIEATTAEKLGALSLIAKRYTPALAPALRKALEDADGSVRVLAATVMAQLNNGHTRHIGALQNIAQAAPTHASWRALAEARLGYAASGLLDADRAQREADEGRACLARADALDAEDGAPEMISHAA